MTNHLITINDLKISYAEENGTGTNTIFFLHGNSTNRLTWEKQLGESKISQFRLIAFDLPAHGSSDALPAGADYTLPNLAVYMAAAVKQLSDGRPYILAGISFGTNVIAEMMAHDLKPNGLLIAGPCIIGPQHSPDKFIIPDTSIGFSFIDNPSDDDLNALIELAINNRNPHTDKLFTDSYKAVKNNFRSRIGQSVADGFYSDQIELIKSKNIPVLVVFGADDKAIYPNYLDDAGLPVWGNEIIKIEDAGHLVNLDAPKLFTGLLAKFANDLFKKDGF